MNIRKLAFILLFLAGGFLAATANLQITIGAVLMAVGYAEFRRQNISIDQIDDEILNELRNLLNRK